MGSHRNFTEKELCNECTIAALKDRRQAHLLIFMCKQKENEIMLKKSARITRLHMAPVFCQIKPNNEKARKNVIYRGAIVWNAQTGNVRNMELDDFKLLQIREMMLSYIY